MESFFAVQLFSKWNCKNKLVLSSPTLCLKWDYEIEESFPSYVIILKLSLVPANSLHSTENTLSLENRKP